MIRVTGKDAHGCSVEQCFKDDDVANATEFYESLKIDGWTTVTLEKGVTAQPTLDGIDAVLDTSSVYH